MFIPHLIVIGQQRCGTSALHKYFSNFPDLISLPRPKETHFFNKRYSYGFKWYRSCFSSCLSKKLVLEFCPSYLCSLPALSRLYYYSKLVPQKPTIVVIRREKAQQTSSLLSYRYQRKQINHPLEDSCLSSNVFSSELLSDSLISVWKLHFPHLVEIPYNQSSLISDFVSVLNHSKLLSTPLPLIPTLTDFVNLSQDRYLNQRHLGFLKPCKEMAIRVFPRYFYS